MSSYSLPPPLPTYHVLLEGEGLGQSLGNFKDDLLNVCMRHVEKMCKADLSRNFIERNHMENGRFPLVGRLQGHGHFSPRSIPAAWCRLASGQLALCCFQPPIVPKMLGLGFRDCSLSLKLLPRLGSHYKGPPGKGASGHQLPKGLFSVAIHQNQGLVSFRSASDCQAHSSYCMDVATRRARLQTGDFADSSRCDL